MPFVVKPPAVVAVPVHGSVQSFPVHRIYCVGRNYADHAVEMGHSGREAPFFFMKPADAVLLAGADGIAHMPYPSLTQSLHHEVELVVAIGQGGRHIAPEEALQHVYGYAVGLDMTRRDLQNAMKQQGRPWSIAKGFDHSAPLGTITPASHVPGLGQARITLQVNGQTRQQGRLDQLIWSIAETIAELSRAWELQAGDLVFTGTPAGVAAVRGGDLLEAHVDGLQPLRVRIVQTLGE